ncbi:patatin-like phospholipase family protein [Paenisporosarcina cavernae]|uniref:Patatin family protein n=1 Tax=Paenisporosarcina cavernae TaxID=2320858 RepID=A0A385YP64_9BACL|nr:patatin family protein [Paenisporosarcina cavernae]AYC28469.1 patatin family protein [Paenisporosarcina cavernae]
MFDSGLILEGGGMRGVYTAGVLEFFMEKECYFPYVIGVSAGACQGASYLSRQKGRNRSVTIDYLSHPDYISLKNLFFKKELFGMDLIFDHIPNNLVPFDFETFNVGKERFVIGTTDCYTGQAVYHDKNAESAEMLSIIRASSSLPFMAKPVEIAGQTLMDGGIADPIPLYKAKLDGVEKPVIVLTKQKGYRKKKSFLSKAYKLFYKEFPGLTNALETRWHRYNELLDTIERLEDEGKVFVIRPSNDFGVSRAERDITKLENFHQQGYEDARAVYEEMTMWLGAKNVVVTS